MAVFLGEGHGVVHVFLDAGILLEIAVDEPLRLAPRDPQVAGQAKAGNAVDHAEIDRLGLPSHVRRHLVQRHVEHFRCRRGVNVFAVAERLFHRLDPGDMRENAQFDLAVVERDQNLALRRDEGFADAAPFFRADRDVLKVRVGRGQPARRRARLQVGRMHPARVRVDVGLERIRVGRFELGQLPPVEHAGRQIVLGRKVLENVGAGGIGPGLALLPAFQTQLVEQDFTKLLGRADIEGLARKFVNLGLKPRHFLRERVGHARQGIAVDLNTVHFHLGEHRHQRAFERLIHRRHLFAVQARLEQLPQSEGHIGVFGRVFHRIFDLHLVEGDRALACPEQRLDRDRGVAEVVFGQRVHAVIVETREHRVGHQHRVVDGRDVQPVAAENLGVVFGVLENLEDRGIFQHWLQCGEHVVEGQLSLRQLIVGK